jgi:hypothetical protein
MTASLSIQTANPESSLKRDIEPASQFVWWGGCFRVVTVQIMAHNVISLMM